ncbi:MAG: hypothetical protein IPH51_20395 [Rubrivivax sp.]|nr:hypothetical protein [Rubrivivax sp.]MBK8526664.1 hypothetical protein [Rubrivivax sp.]
MLLLINALKLIVEIALLSLAGRWVLALLAGAGREGNVFYRVLDIVASPFLKLMRWVSPRMVLDRHVPLATFLLLSVCWVLLTMVKIGLCLQSGVNVCR